DGIVGRPGAGGQGNEHGRGRGEKKGSLHAKAPSVPATARRGDVADDRPALRGDAGTGSSRRFTAPLSGPGQRTDDVVGQVSWLAGRQPPFTPSRSPSGAGDRSPYRRTASPPTVAGTAAVFDRVPLTACEACRRAPMPVQDARLRLERAGGFLHPVALP